MKMKLIFSIIFIICCISIGIYAQDLPCSVQIRKDVITAQWTALRDECMPTVLVYDLVHDHVMPRTLAANTVMLPTIPFGTKTGEQTSTGTHYSVTFQTRSDGSWNDPTWLAKIGVVNGMLSIPIWKFDNTTFTWSKTQTVALPIQTQSSASADIDLTNYHTSSVSGLGDWLMFDNNPAYTTSLTAVGSDGTRSIGLFTGFNPKDFQDKPASALISSSLLVSSLSTCLPTGAIAPYDCQPSSYFVPAYQYAAMHSTVDGGRIPWGFVTDSDREAAKRWGSTLKYDYLWQHPDLITLFRLAPMMPNYKQRWSDPAVFLAEFGWPSPAVDCTINFTEAASPVGLICVRKKPISTP